MMKFIKNLQTCLILAAFLGTIAILFGGQALTEKLKVTDPLKEEILSKKEIRQFSVQPEEKGIKVELRMNKTADLQSVMEFVKEKAEFYHKKPVTDLVINGSPNSRLEQVKYQLSFYLEEAVASGHYIQLKSALDAYKAEGINAKVYLTDDFIYLQLEEGVHYLYQAIPRSSKFVTFNNSIPGGDSV